MTVKAFKNEVKKDEKPLILAIRNSGDGVDIIAVNEEGEKLSFLIHVTPDKKFIRSGNVNKTLGLNINKKGRLIIE